MDTRRKIGLAAAVALLALAPAGCDERADKNRQALVGDWELVKGFRNQKPTESLEGATFHFGGDGKMSTNLPLGIENPSDFEVSKNTVRQFGRQTVEYTIQALTDTSLVLKFEMRSIEFELRMRRVSGEN